MTVGLEMGGVDVVRQFIEPAKPEHPSLVDEAHRMDALFGVTNIPQVVWIDENGIIVRPPERGSPAPVESFQSPDPLYERVIGIMHRGQEHVQWYGDRIRDWVANGAASEWALSPDEVIAKSHPRSPEVSAGAAHFELAQHLWREQGFSSAALAHFAAAHTLQPENITYKRQAYSAWSYGQNRDPSALFAQSPAAGEEDAWPFVSDFNADMAQYMRPGGSG